MNGMKCIKEMFDTSSYVLNFVNAYGGVSLIGKVDVLSLIHRKDGGVRNGYYFNEDEYPFLESTWAIKKAVIVYTYCNPRCYSRSRRGYGKCLGSVNHYINVTIDVEFDNRITKSVFVYQAKGNTKEEALQLVAKHYNKYTGMNLLEADKKSNLELFKLIYEKQQESTYKSVSHFDLVKATDNSMNMNNCLLVLEKAGYIKRETRTVGGSTKQFDVYKTTEKGIIRLKEVL